MHILCCALDKNAFDMIYTFETAAHQIWHTLEATLEGTNKIKESKEDILIHDHELFEIIKQESITKIFTKFTNTINALQSLD